MRRNNTEQTFRIDPENSMTTVISAQELQGRFAMDERVPTLEVVGQGQSGRRTLSDQGNSADSATLRKDS